MCASHEEWLGIMVCGIFRIIGDGFAALQWCDGLGARTESARSVRHFEIAIDSD
jgi:hypothetical protein